MPLKMIDGKFGWKETSKEDIEKTKAELSDHASSTKTYVPEVVTPTPGKLVPVAKKIDVMQFAGANANIMASIEQLLIKGIKAADIILPIYGSLHIAKHCINTVLTRTKWPFHLTIVDDGSDAHTVDWLKRQDWPENVTVLFNKKNRGFSATVNRGIRNSNSPYVCVLNSDVLVTKLWLTKMIIALESSSKNVIVNPVTNNTAMINVDMQEGCDYLAMNQAFEKTSQHRYPEIMPTGFCFLFHRTLTDIVGLFDEGYQNYGEELFCLQTQVLTPTGFTTVGDLKIGDVVFDPDGKQTKVIKTTRVSTDKVCYELTFNTGESIVSDENHPWVIHEPKYIRALERRGEKDHWRTDSYKNRITANNLFDDGLSTKEVAEKLNVSLRTSQTWAACKRKGTILDKSFKEPTQVTTREIAEELIVRKNLYKNNIPVAKTLSMDPQDLSLDPYLLGLWLGDGTTKQAQITTIDKEVLQAFREDGWIIKHSSKYTYNIYSSPKRFLFRKKLKELKVFGNKHVPPNYLLGSFDQRLALLQGLMDTDGHCRKDGKCSFDNSNLNLIHSAAHLVRSLGLRCFVNKGSPKKKEHHKEMYRVIFKPDNTLPVFRLPYKLKRLPIKRRSCVNYHKVIKARKVPSVPVKCISVDSPTGMLLVGKSLIPGKNSDMWMKAITYLKDGYYLKHKAVLADDTYLFHERGSSFSALHSEKHMDLRKSASARFHRTWPQYATWIKANPAGKILAPYREKLPRKAVTKMGAEYRICWVVRATAMCGGMKYISDIVNEINERGGDARVALVLRNSNNPGEILPELRTRPIIFSSEEEFIQEFPKRVFKKGIVVAAISELAHHVHNLCELNTELTGVNHVQSYDPMIAQDDELKKTAREAYPKLGYTITNSQWITDTLKKEYKIKALGTIHPGVDRSLYYPRGRERGDERPTVLIALNRKYHYRGFNRGALLARYLNQISNKKNLEIRIMACGVEAMPEAPNVIGLGELVPTRLAHVLGTEVDLFIDPSEYHSYGLPGLEAMASGVPFLCWDNIGVNEYGENGKDCVILSKDTPPDEAALEAFKLLAKVEIRKTFAYAGLDKVKQHDRAYSVDKFITIIEKELGLSYPKRKIVFVTPHLRKHGGPTTIIQAANEMLKRGHDVSLTCVIPDLNPEVTIQSRAPINLDFKNIPECDVLIVPSDNHDSNFFHSLPQAKHKINFKMGHNERFKDNEEGSLKLKWDKTITTTEWLADVCRKPTKDWDYPPTENVERVGWFHYSHGKFNCPPNERTYGGQDSSFIITTLIHHHPLKGTMEALSVLDRLRRKYKLEVVGVGEVNPKQLQLPPWVRYMHQPNRDRMAEIFKQTDIWLGASFTEGLGRISLEAMSAGAACVISDTDPEFATHRENCLLYPIGDKDAMEKAVEELLEDDSLFQKIREKGYNTAKRCSSPVHFVEALEKIVYEVCEK